MGLNGLFAALGSLVLERLPGGRFVRRSSVPDWCLGLAAEELRADAPFAVQEVFPFLEAFLDDAETTWRGGASRVASDFWTEATSFGDIHLEASAVRLNSAPMLVITENTRLFQQQQLVLQRARELRLTHDALMREFELKDILVHTIVHDLASPLHSVLGALSLLDELPLAEDGKQWIRIAFQAANRQRQLISEILDVFSAESSSLRAMDGGETPRDLGAVIAHVLAEMQPIARQRGVQLSSSLAEPSYLVGGEEHRLFRVLVNLVDNALRHSPQGAEVRIIARREGAAVLVAIEDQGPGVSPALLPHLFEQFARGRERGGTGLGLYFCRITMERWGGGIGYEPRPEGGARFWIRVPLVDTGDMRGRSPAKMGGAHGQTADPR